jgi:hypothetical protein
MRVHRYICDRCEVEYPNEDTITRLQCYPNDQGFRERTLDLCKSCYTMFLTFLKAK